MLDSARFRDLAQQALDTNHPGRLRKILAEMEAMLRAEQRDLKQVLAERRSRYPGPPVEPGVSQ